MTATFVAVGGASGTLELVGAAVAGADENMEEPEDPDPEVAEDDDVVEVPVPLTEVRGVADGVGDALSDPLAEDDNDAGRST